LVGIAAVVWHRRDGVLDRRLSGAVRHLVLLAASIDSHPIFYRRVHRWHHVEIAPVVWTNNSDRLIDNLFLQSYWLIAHLLIPVAPAVLFAHKIYDEITGVIGHSGYEHGGRWCWPPSPLIGVTHHDQHHQFVRCNYATHFSWWDRMMGTLHPDHDRALKANISGPLRPRHSA
jgi:Delta7-sterol 5-desaturase